MNFLVMQTRCNPETDIKTRGVSTFREQFASELLRLCKRCPAYSEHDSVPGSSWELREPPVITMPRVKRKLLKWRV